MAYEPENTLRSLRHALDLGVAAVEVDVHLSRDGHLVVIHDDTVDRTTDGHGRVAALTLEELKRLDAGKGERIPTLAEVVDLVRGRVELIIELKAPDAGPELLRFVKERQLHAEAWVISFWHPKVRELKVQDPQLHTGLLMVGCPADPVGLARAALADGLFLQYAYVTPELVAAAQAHGLKVYIWNIDTVEILKPYLNLPLDGIGSNRPDVPLEYLRQVYGNDKRIKHPK